MEILVRENVVVHVVERKTNQSKKHVEQQEAFQIVVVVVVDFEHCRVQCWKTNFQALTVEEATPFERGEEKYNMMKKKTFKKELCKVLLIFLYSMIYILNKGVV